jgi:hypothetical protein
MEITSNKAVPNIVMAIGVTAIFRASLVRDERLRMKAGSPIDSLPENIKSQKGGFDSRRSSGQRPKVSGANR